MAPVTGIPVGESFGGQSQAAAVIAAAREAENFSRNLRAVAERETRAFSVSIDGAVRQAQKRVDERVDAAIAARVDPAIMSALEKAPKTTALVDKTDELVGPRDGQQINPQTKNKPLPACVPFVSLLSSPMSWRGMEEKPLTAESSMETYLQAWSA